MGSCVFVRSREPFPIVHRAPRVTDTSGVVVAFEAHVAYGSMVPYDLMCSVFRAERGKPNTNQRKYRGSRACRGYVLSAVEGGLPKAKTSSAFLVSVASISPTRNEFEYEAVEEAMSEQARIAHGAGATPEDVTPIAAPNPELESLATGVELTLASVLQGIALAILVPKIVELITSGEVSKLPYIPASAYGFW